MSVSPAEPSLEALPNPALRYFVATRPQFLGVTLAAALVGLGAACHDGIALSAPTALATVVFALVAHAGVNVLNDYYDELNGSDRANTERVYPFSGGSRIIQNGVLTARQTRAFGLALFALVVPAGLWLASVSGPGLILIGAAGLFIGWAYSAPPLALNSRALGEPCVALGFVLIVIGADFVQRGGPGILATVAAVPYALLVTNILYVNQFPDRRADAQAGKRNWVVALGARRARWVYAAVALAAYGFLAIAAGAGAVPGAALVALLPAALSAWAFVDVIRFVERPQALVRAIRLTIAAALLHGALLALALALSAPAGR